MRTLPRAGAFVAAAVPLASLLLVAGVAAPAFATTDDSYTVRLRQDLPRTSTTDDGGAPQKSSDQCPGVPAGQDGWHFVLPGNSTDFVKLTVTFEPGGQQVVTDFGPPSDKHAYVASLPGAELTSAVAEVSGGDLELFNLSHTCPAADGTTPGTDTPGASAEPTADASESPDGTVTEPDDTATKPDGDEPAGAVEGEASPSAGVASASPAAQGGEGDLAETGSGAPVGLLAAAAAALLGAGGYLVFRRRKA
ncbi:LPXTG cell wall anchor domain-containing protein [Streptomyces sp. NPDC002838]|uniref:LPXTG cell wall anchor domain-containing protein n=1 Tax=Streptomyces sp. NPDC002838 TaxID=3154436 RepID=UPI00332438B5